MTTIDDVRQFIGRDATAAELIELGDLVKRAQKSRSLTAPVGTRAKLVNISPKRLAGLTGTIEGYKGERVLFKPDVPQPRYGDPMRVPAASVVPL